MQRLRSLGVLSSCLLAIPSLPAQTNKITAGEAKDHIGDRAAVCGKVASAHYTKSSKGQPTFLNPDEPYPREVFTILIGFSDREKFGAPESEYKGLRLCIAGKITSYRGAAEMVATERGQIEVHK